MAVTVTEERRAMLWQRAERIRVVVDSARAVRAALAEQRAGRAESTGR
ncbi:hypothetical protein ACIQPR_48800 [Streptomyces sp. NPDC091280]